MEDQTISCLLEGANRVKETNMVLSELLNKFGQKKSEIIRGSGINPKPLNNDIYRALLNISEPLAVSYRQVKQDIEDNERTSWGGTAHELREILRVMLEELAPDDKVSHQPWFLKDKNSNRPTQKQRVRYILELHNAGSKACEVVEQVASFEDMIGNVVRATYSRASDAAHRSKSRREVARIIKYFDVFAHDLLNID
jgi:hypothetical protein